MPVQSTSTRYVSLLEINQADPQNVQELAAIWGELENELAELGIEVEASYAVLGQVDFLVIYDAPGHDEAFQAGTIFERRGFDAQTLEVTPTADFATLVEDL